MKVVKGKSREPRECFMLEDDRHFLPRGIYFIKRIQGNRSFLPLNFKWVWEVNPSDRAKGDLFLFLLFDCVEPWTYAHSRSAKRLYFFNKDTNEATFESPRDSAASFK